jgi:pyruvate formate lyase activating enzyme
MNVYIVVDIEGISGVTAPAQIYPNGSLYSEGRRMMTGDINVCVKACKEAGLHTAIESTGNAPFSDIEKLLPYLDLYLLDIKHMDSKKHEEYTGAPNERILENARLIAESGVDLIVRTPVVPTFNDTDRDIKAIADFVRSLKTVKEYHLLPYHRLGTDKYKGLGRGYTLSEILPPEKERMQYLLSVAETSGVKCQIGG